MKRVIEVINFGYGRLMSDTTVFWCETLDEARKAVNDDWCMLTDNEKKKIGNEYVLRTYELDDDDLTLSAAQDYIIDNDLQSIEDYVIHAGLKEIAENYYDRHLKCADVERMYDIFGLSHSELTTVCKYITELEAKYNF